MRMLTLGVKSPSWIFGLISGFSGGREPFQLNCGLAGLQVFLQGVLANQLWMSEVNVLKQPKFVCQ